MKKDTHPTVHAVIYRDSNAKKDFYAYSTQTSKETETIDGVEYQIFRVDITSASHPFYTGKQNLIDTSGRVDKFKAKMEKAKSAKK